METNRCVPRGYRLDFPVLTLDFACMAVITGR